MSKKKILIVVLILAGLGGVFLLSLSPAQEQTSKADNNTDNTNEKTTSKQEVDKVKVYYFHNTARCVSCKTLEKYTKETIEEFFQPELRDGKIEFKGINVDLPKNKEIARKYGATGSSLFINQIINGEDKIEQDTKVWRYLSNENTFKNYFKNKIESSLN